LEHSRTYSNRLSSGMLSQVEAELHPQHPLSHPVFLPVAVR